MNKTMEILNFDSMKTDEGFQIHIHAVTTDKDDGKQDFLTLRFVCQSSGIKFNELKRESWFENFNQL